MIRKAIAVAALAVAGVAGTATVANAAISGPVTNPLRTIYCVQTTHNGVETSAKCYTTLAQANIAVKAANFRYMILCKDGVGGMCGWKATEITLHV